MNPQLRHTWANAGRCFTRVFWIWAAWVQFQLCGATAADGSSKENHLPRLLHRAHLPAPTAAPLPEIPTTWPNGLDQDTTASLRKSLAELRSQLETLRTHGAPPPTDAFADAALYYKSIVWALRYETSLNTSDLSLIRRAIQLSQDRTEALATSSTQWNRNRGKMARGYVSLVDGSIQPFGLIFPATYDPSKPTRLDVVLHGSSRPSGLSELRFLAPFDGEANRNHPPSNQDFIELHPLGRVENCYRWAGETDVFEAIEAVCRNYRIDRNRVVLRGMSMGASGTWHLGLKHPDEFAALGPYCGYVDTHRFSETPVPGFIRVGPLPPNQERTLHLLDSIDYAANVGVVPTVAAIGDQDIFYQAHVIMSQAIAADGLDMNQIISAGTGHVIDPETHKEQLRRIAVHVDAGLNHEPKELRFVTRSLKYNRCHWFELLSQAEPYDRSEFCGRVRADGSLEIDPPINITRFAIDASILPVGASEVLIGDHRIPVKRQRYNDTARPIVFAIKAGRWRCASGGEGLAQDSTLPGLQGPIDDAFTAPFVCVRGTGTPWNAGAEARARETLRRFQQDWAKYMRGELPVVDDTQLTESDLKTKNLVLFGDPGSNRWIRRALPKLPLKWTRRELRIQGESWDAGSHLPRLATRNPLKSGGQNYLVLNSGHSFGEADFAAFNYLLFPKIGDWAVEEFQTAGSGVGDEPGMVIRTGFWDGSWAGASERFKTTR